MQSPPGFGKLRLESERLTEVFDHLVLFCVQPVVAGLAILGLATDSEAATAVSRPIFIWVGIVLITVIFAEGIWSFAARHVQRRRLGVLWIKLLGAGVSAILVFASSYRHLGMVDEGRVSHDLWTALYFSVSAWTTVGFGDVVPTHAARLFAAAESLVGVVYTAAVLGLVIYAMTNRTPRVVEPGPDA